MFGWLRHFEKGEISVKKGERPGRLFRDWNDKTFKKMCSLVKEDWRLTLKEIFYEVKISVGLYQAVSIEILKMRWVAAKLFHLSWHYELRISTAIYLEVNPLI